MSDERPHVTIVDDDESIREALPDLLREEGFYVSTHASAEAFLGAQIDACPDCLILDVAMPGLSGPELKREIDRRGGTSPVIFITAQQDDRLRKSLLALGAAAVLFKPIRAVTLLDAIKVALDPGERRSP